MVATGGIKLLSIKVAQNHELMDDQDSNRALHSKHDRLAAPLFWVTVIIMGLTAILVWQGYQQPSQSKGSINEPRNQPTLATKPLAPPNNSSPGLPNNTDSLPPSNNGHGGEPPNLASEQRTPMTLVSSAPLSSANAGWSSEALSEHTNFSPQSGIRTVAAEGASGKETRRNVGDTTPNARDDKPQVIKAFGDLVVELHSLKAVNGKQYLLTMTLTNASTKNSLWVALGTDHYGFSKSSLIDPNSVQFGTSALTGISYARVHVQYLYNGPMAEYFDPATEIQPGDSTTVTVMFASPDGRRATSGMCSLQLEFFLGNGLVLGHPKHATTPSLIAKIGVE
jgi:hypothetical protein